MHSIFFCNGDGMILYKRYYKQEEDKTIWETRIFSRTNKRWSHARNEVHQCAELDERFVVFTFWGDILVIIVGEDEYDELALSDVLDTLAEYIKEIFKKPLQELTENYLLQNENYEKFCIGLDEIISSTGILDQTDISKIIANYKVKTAGTNKPKTPVQKFDNNFTNTSFDDVKFTNVSKYLIRTGLPLSYEGQE